MAKVKDKSAKALLVEVPCEAIPEGANVFRHLAIEFVSTDREDQITIACVRRALVNAGAMIRKNGVQKPVEDWQDVFRWMVQNLTAQRVAT